MRTLAQVFALLVVLALAGSAYAAEAKKNAAPKSVRGEIVKIEGTNITIKTGGKQPKELTVATDDKTKFVSSGKPIALADLKVGQAIVATPATGTAKKIQVPKPKAPKAPPAQK